MSFQDNLQEFSASLELAREQMASGAPPQPLVTNRKKPTSQLLLPVSDWKALGGVDVNAVNRANDNQDNHDDEIIVNRAPSPTVANRPKKPTSVLPLPSTDWEELRASQQD